MVNTKISEEMQALIVGGYILSVNYSQAYENIELHFQKVSNNEDSSNDNVDAYNLRLLACSWRLETDTEFLAGSDDDEDKILQALNNIINCKIHSFVLNFETLEATLNIASIFKLHLFPTTYLTDAAYWTIYNSRDEQLYLVKTD